MDYRTISDMDNKNLLLIKEVNSDVILGTIFVKDDIYLATPSVPNPVTKQFSNVMLARGYIHTVVTMGYSYKQKKDVQLKIM